ncbi:hypothetical protein [Burkholderia stagnalis]
MMWMLPEENVGVYVHATDRDSARRVVLLVSGSIFHEKAGFFDVEKIRSYDELIAAGVSDDLDLRIFEVSHEDRKVTQWIERPLFVSIDQSLIGKWVSLSIERAMASVVQLRL